MAIPDQAEPGNGLDLRVLVLAHEHPGSISWRYRAAHWRRGCVPLKPGALHLSNMLTC